MKALLRPTLGVLCGLSLTSAAYAFDSDRAGNGGDECEKRIQNIRDDIGNWIKGGGSSGLRLPSGVSVDNYNQKMNSEIAKSGISCQDSPVLVGSAEKTCKNYVDAQGKSQILCNRHAFMSETTQDQQYLLIHHEYAGLAGLEASEGSSSNYSISNQLSAYLVTVAERKLALIPEKAVFRRSTSAYDPAIARVRDTFSQGQLPTEAELSLGKTWQCTIMYAQREPMDSNYMLLSFSRAESGVSGDYDGKITFLFGTEKSSTIERSYEFSPKQNSLSNFGQEPSGVMGSTYIRATKDGMLVLENVVYMPGNPNSLYSCEALGLAEILQPITSNGVGGSRFCGPNGTVVHVGEYVVCHL